MRQRVPFFAVELDREIYGIDPHEYCGIVMNEPEEQIPRLLAQETARVGSLELWEYQSFAHHDHPTVGMEEGAAELEMAIVELWAGILRSRFSEMSFVIEVSPMDRMTWYQVTPNAPTADDERFTSHVGAARISVPEELGTMPREERAQVLKDALRAANDRPRRTGDQGACERCGALDHFSAVTESPIHRGIRLVRCLACHAELIHSTRIIRTVIGPE